MNYNGKHHDDTRVGTEQSNQVYQLAPSFFKDGLVFGLFVSIEATSCSLRAGAYHSLCTMKQ